MKPLLILTGLLLAGCGTQGWQPLGGGGYGGAVYVPERTHYYDADSASWDALQTQIAIDGQTRAIREAAAMQADAINNAALMEHYGH